VGTAFCARGTPHPGSGRPFRCERGRPATCPEAPQLDAILRLPCQIARGKTLQGTYGPPHVRWCRHRCHASVDLPWDGRWTARPCHARGEDTLGEFLFFTAVTDPRPRKERCVALESAASWGRLLDLEVYDAGRETATGVYLARLRRGSGEVVVELVRAR
jgi:hypothetical protein